MAVAPDPRRLLLPDPDIIPSFLSDKWFPIFSSAICLVGVFTFKYVTNRPLLSGIQYHIVGGVGGALVGKYFHERHMNYLANKDAVYRHYIDLHPEDFPMPERVKVGDMFKKWTPIR